MVCGDTFPAWELQIAKDGSGSICAACAARREGPDVRKLLRGDDRKRGFWLIALGLLGLIAGGYVSWVVVELQRSTDDLGLTPRPTGRVVMFAALGIIGGITSIAFGLRAIGGERARDRSIGPP